MRLPRTLPRDVIKTICICTLFITAGASAIIGKVFAVPELTTASVGAIGIILGYLMRSNGDDRSKVIVMALLYSLLSLSGCKTNVKIDTPCAVKAAMVCASELTPCFGLKNNTEIEK